MSLQEPLAFNEGVYLVPVAELSEEVRGKLAAEDGDFALTRPQGRTGSKIVDPDAAALLERFRQPRSLVEAVVLFSRARGEDPEAVLDGAYPLIKGLLASGYLVPVGDGEAAPPAAGPLAARWQPGDELLGGRVVRPLQVLEDTELYLLRRGATTGVLKVERAREGHAGARIRAMLEREAAVLAALPPGLGPALLGRGEVDGRFYLEMERIAGIEVDAEAAVRREAARSGGVAAGGEAAGRLLDLLRAVAGAYAALHRAGVLHGDVHPRNVLVDRSGAVRLIDFGLAVPAATSAAPAAPAARGGVPFFYEPELARAYLEDRPPAPASPAGEQFSLAALLYYLATGAYRRDYPLGRDEMLREIAELPPLPFIERGVPAWPDLEAVLGRALAIDPAARFASTEDLRRALGAVEPGAPAGGRPTAGAAAELLARSLEAAAPGGGWSAGAGLPKPRASINYGAAGVSLGLLRIAQARGEARPLALARPWLGRALSEVTDEGGFYDPEIEITRDTVGEASPYHSPAGVFAAQALLARASGDLPTQARATASFLTASEEGHHGLDLTLGVASTLLGSALLLDAWPAALAAEEPPLRQAGDRRCRELWRELDRKPEIAEADVESLGVAHGWAGFLYATLTWCRLTGAPPPPRLEGRLAELADLARPAGRGLTWPWLLRGDGSRATMPGWCNGSCGYVFLWTLAATLLDRRDLLDLAVGSAWDAWDAPDLSASLCCGLAGRGYALLNLHRATGERAWLDRARQLAERAAARGGFEDGHRHSLWKGEMGLAALAADLERPDDAAMPFFEPTGYRA